MPSPKLSNAYAANERAKTKVSNTTPKKTMFTVMRNTIPLEEVPDCSCDDGNSRVRGTPMPNRPVNVHHHCRRCNNYVTYSKAGVVRHEVMVHSIRHAGVNIYECPVCSKLFIHVSEYQRHIKMHSARSRDPKVRAIIRNEDNKCEALIVKTRKPTVDPDFKFNAKGESKKDLLAFKQELMSSSVSGMGTPQPNRGLLINGTPNAFGSSPALLSQREMPTLVPVSTEQGPAPGRACGEMPTLTPFPKEQSNIIRFCRDNTLMCDINGCQWKMVLVADMKEHVLLSHGLRLNKLQGYCDRCIKPYSHYAYFLTHLKQKHGIAENIKLEQLEEIGQQENRVNNLNVNSSSPGHMTPSQSQQGPNAARDPKEIKTIQFHPDQKLHCHIEACNFTVTILSEMRVHLKSYHKVKVKFQKGLCQMCQYAPNKYKNFEKHLRNKHNVEPGDLGIDKQKLADPTKGVDNRTSGESDQNVSQNNEVNNASESSQQKESRQNWELGNQSSHVGIVEFQNNDELFCQFENCQFKATNLTDIGKHIHTGHGQKIENFKGTCQPCAFSVTKFGKLEDHLVEQHSLERRVNHSEINNTDGNERLNMNPSAAEKQQLSSGIEIPIELLPCIQFRHDRNIHCHATGCIYSTVVLSDLKAHIADFHGESITTLKAFCCVCNMSFARYERFPSHLQWKHSIQLGHGFEQTELLEDVNCLDQPEIPVSINLPADASNISISLQEDKKIHCHVDGCSFKCAAMEDVKSHLSASHGRPVKSVETYCGICSAYYSTLSTFSRHSIWKHSVEIYADAPPIPQTPTTIRLPQDGSTVSLSIQEDNKLYCHIEGCNFVCTTLNDIKTHCTNIHKRTVGALESFCGICMFFYQKYGSFSQHVIWKHDLQYAGDDNDQVPADANQVRNQSFGHATDQIIPPMNISLGVGGMPFITTNPTTVSPAENWNESKIVRFRNDNRIHCYNENCNFSATTANDLTQHVRYMHGVVSKYLQGYCEICKSFSNRYYNFASHLRQRHHVGIDESFVSGSLGMFTPSGSLGMCTPPQAYTDAQFLPDEFTDVSMMLRYKNNRIHCYNKACSFNATNTSDMTVHLRSVHGMSLGRLQGLCEMCGSYANRASNFFTHLRQKHSVQTGDRRSVMGKFDPMDPEENQLDEAITQNVEILGENISTLGVFHPELISADELEYEFFPDSDDDEISKEIQKHVGPIRYEKDGLHCFDDSCKFVCRLPVEMRVHVRIDHQRVTRELSGVCELCGKTFKKYKKFKKHVIAQHDGEVEQTVQEKENLEPKESTESGQPTVLQSQTNDLNLQEADGKVEQTVDEKESLEPKESTESGQPTIFQSQTNDPKLQEPEPSIIQSQASDPKLEIPETTGLQGNTHSTTLQFPEIMLSYAELAKLKVPEQTECRSEPSGRISCRKDKMLHCQFGECVFETKFLIEAREHVSAIHGETEMQGYCEVCDIAHAKYTRFKQHVVSKHSIEMGVPGTYNSSNSERQKSNEKNKKSKPTALRTPSPVKSHLLPSSPVKACTVPVVEEDFIIPETQHLPGHEQPTPEIKPSLYIHFKEDKNLHCLFKGCNFLSPRHSEIRVHVQSAHGAYLRSIRGVCKVCNSEYAYKHFIHHLKNKHAVETGWTGRESAVFNISVHNKTKIFCGGCSKKLRFRKGRKDLLKEHITQVHKVSIAQLMYYCPACTTSTLNYYTFKLHLLQEKHRAKFLSSDKIRNKESKDQPSYEFLKILELCRLPARTKEPGEEDSQNVQNKIVITCHQEGIIECKKCKEIFRGTKHMYEHTLQWHPSDELVYHCTLCDMKFSNGKDFHCHLSSTLHKITVLEGEVSEDDTVSEDEVNDTENSAERPRTMINDGTKNDESIATGRRDSTGADPLRRPSITGFPGQGTSVLPMVKQEPYVPKIITQRDVDKDYQPKEPIQNKKKALFKVQYGTDDKLHCGHCSFSDTIEVNMKNHLIHQHKEKLSFAFCVCEPCNQCYNCYFPFKYHVQQSHGIRESEDMTRPTPSIKIDVTETGLIRCTKCDFTSNEPQHVRNHATYAHKIKQVFLQFECLPCKMMTRQYNNFTSHLNFSKHKKTLERHGRKRDDDDATSAYGDDVANLNDVADEDGSPLLKKIKTEPNTDPQIAAMDEGKSAVPNVDTNNTSTASGDRTWMDVLPPAHRTSLDEEKATQPVEKDTAAGLQKDQVNTISKDVPKKVQPKIRFVCKECPTVSVFSSMDELMNHKKNVHSSKPATFRCKSCNLDAPTYKGFIDHIRVVHQGGRIKMLKSGSTKTQVSTVQPRVASAPMGDKPAPVSETTGATSDREDLRGKLIKKLDTADDKSGKQKAESSKPDIDPSRTAEAVSTPSVEKEITDVQVVIAPQFRNTLKSALENVEMPKKQGRKIINSSEEKPEVLGKKPQTTSQVAKLDNEDIQSNMPHTTTPDLIKQDNEVKHTCTCTQQEEVAGKAANLDSEDEENRKKAEVLGNDEVTEAAKREVVPKVDRSDMGNRRPFCRCYCNICKMRFKNMRRFEIHLATNHSGIQPIITCRPCEKRFRTKKSTMKHVNSDEHKRKVKAQSSTNKVDISQERNNKEYLITK